jgi:methyl-accepting chemotaxis protein
VNTTVMATETGAKTVDAGTRQFSDVTGSLTQIKGLVITTNEAAREIELSTKQQASAVEQVSTAIVSVGQAAKEFEATSTQTIQAVSQLTKLANALLRVIRPEAAESA